MGVILVDYESALLKVDRALEHLDALEEEQERWLSSHPVELIGHPTDDPLTTDLITHVLIPLPNRLALMFGDCVHNLRSALDHLVVALGTDNAPFSDQTNTKFPICAKQVSYWGNDGHGDLKTTHNSHVATLSGSAQDFIEHLQPYYRGITSWTLMELQELDNTDKHRSLVILGTQMAAAVVTSGFKVDYADPLRLVDGERFATVTAPSPNQTAFGFTFTTQVAVASKAPRLITPYLLRNVFVKHVRDDIIGEAQKLFP